MSSFSSKLFVFVAIYGNLAIAANASGDTHDLQEMVNSSNLILIGSVSALTYELSEPSKSDSRMPFSFVTFKVEKVLRGSLDGDTITFQVMGGPNGKGHFVFGSNLPVFQSNARELVMLRSNGSGAECPLVDCDGGRFRILDGRVYDPGGIPIVKLGSKSYISNGTIAPEFRTIGFPSPKFDDLLAGNPKLMDVIKDRNLTIEEARKLYESQVPAKTVFKIVNRNKAVRPDTGGIKPPASTLPTKPVSVDRFLSLIDRLVGKSASEPKKIKSVDLGKPISFPLTSAVKLPK